MVRDDPGRLGDLAARCGHSAAIPWNVWMMRFESSKAEDGLSLLTTAV
jgi:hypothetical protein